MYFSDSLRTATVIPGQHYPANLPCGDNGCMTMVMKTCPLHRCPACQERRRLASVARSRAKARKAARRKDNA